MAFYGFRHAGKDEVKSLDIKKIEIRLVRFDNKTTLLNLGKQLFGVKYNVNKKRTEVHLRSC